MNTCCHHFTIGAPRAHRPSCQLTRRPLQQKTIGQPLSKIKRPLCLLVAHVPLALWEFRTPASPRTTAGWTIGRPQVGYPLVEHKEKLEYEKYSDVMMSGRVGSRWFSSLHPRMGAKWTFSLKMGKFTELFGILETEKVTLYRQLWRF